MAILLCPNLQLEELKGEGEGEGGGGGGRAEDMVLHANPHNGLENPSVTTYFVEKNRY